MTKSTRAFLAFTALLCVFMIGIPAQAVDSGAFTVVNGVLTKYAGTETDLVIPNDLGIVSIGESAFSGCSALKAIAFPDSVTSIGAYAFKGCGLTAVSIPVSVDSIGDGAFLGCSGLKSVAIPGHIDTMGNGVFDETRIPEPMILNSGTLLCYVPADYTEYIIPNTVTEIGGGAVAKPFSKLTSVTIPDSVTTIGAGAFSMCSQLTTVSLPKSVTSIGDGAFSRCSSLASVELPNGITAIHNYTFTDCFALTAIKLPNSITEIGDYAFSCCDLKELVLPNCLASIGKAAFNGNAELTSILIPNSVTAIGEGAFAACQKVALYGDAASYARQYAEGNGIRFTSSLIAAPLEYALSVDGKQASIRAYAIKGGIYFKLRDLAMALNGSKKQFNISWSADENLVALITGKAYTPIGGEVHTSDHNQNALARPATAGFVIDGKPAAGLSYVVDNANYIRMSDLAATLRFEMSLNETLCRVDIRTTPEASKTTLTGQIFDNISILKEGNTYTLDKEGSAILSYDQGRTQVRTPLKLDTGAIYKPGLEASDVAFYIAKEKTAIAFGGSDGPIQILITNDLGNTWHTYAVESSENMSGCKYLSFSSANDGWLAVSSGVALGTSYNFIFVTHDGGKTWSQIGNPNDVYARVPTGAGFADNQIGFMCFRYEFSDFEPAVCRTLDGGNTWEKLSITLPEEYDAYHKTPLSPVFYGANGLLPIQLSDSSGYSEIRYLSSSDYGMTWRFNR